MMIIVGAVLANTLLIPLVDAEGSNTTVVDTASTLPTGTSLVIQPNKAQLEPLQLRKFEAKAFDPSGAELPLNANYLSWRVTNGGGTINQDGVFRAWDLTGDYPNTIQAKYYGLIAVAHVRIALAESVPTITPATSAVSPTVANQVTAKPTIAPVATTPTGGSTINSPTPTQKVTPTREPTPTSKIDSASDRPTATVGPSVTTRPTQKPSSALATPVPTPTEVVRPFTAQGSVYYQADSVKVCLVSVFGVDQYAKYFDPTGERVDPKLLGDRLTAADRCFKKNRVVDVDVEHQDCLIKELGQTRYREIAVDLQTPTRAELQVVAKCSSSPRQVQYTSVQETDTVVESCLAVKIGRERLEEIKNKTRTPTQEELSLGRECYNLEESVTRPPLALELPVEAKSCLSEALGEVRAKEITVNHAQPTEAEKAKAQNCFAQVQPEQEVLMPAPSEQIPFIAVSAAENKINKVSARLRESQTTLEIRGSTIPNANVDIYLFSDPIVVSTKSDANGDWYYELSYHLPEGDHQAYSVVYHPDKGLVKSDVMEFSIAAAAAADEVDTTGNLLAPQFQVTQKTNSQGVKEYMIGGVVVTLSAVGLLLVIFYLWDMRRTGTNLPPSLETQTVEEHPDAQ